MYSDELLLPLFRRLAARLPGLRLFDAHTHLGDHDPDGFRLALPDPAAPVFTWSSWPPHWPALQARSPIRLSLMLRPAETRLLLGRLDPVHPYEERPVVPRRGSAGGRSGPAGDREVTRP